MTGNPTTGWWSAVARDVVAIAGGDAARYLQGQVSQDIDAIEAGDSAWTLVLSPQGRIDAWCRLHKRPDGSFIADLDVGFAEALIDRLERFKLRVDVQLTPLEWSMIAVRGGGLTVPEPAADEVVAVVDWPGLAGYDHLAADPAPPAHLDEVDADHLEYHRIAAGVPRMGVELREKTIPAEAGIVDISASFTKGCYTGQELVARIDSRGNRTPRRLHRLSAEQGTSLGAGDDVVLDGDVVGTVTSAASRPDQPTVALAYIHRSVELPADLRVGGVGVSVVDG